MCLRKADTLVEWYCRDLWLTRCWMIDIMQPGHLAGDAAALDELPARQVQPGKGQALLDKWRWVAEGELNDCSWLHFALYAALQQLVCSKCWLVTGSALALQQVLRVPAPGGPYSSPALVAITLASASTCLTEALQDAELLLRIRLLQGDDEAAWQHLAMANHMQSVSQPHSVQAEQNTASTLLAAFPDPASSKGLYPALMQVRHIVIADMPGLRGTSRSLPHTHLQARPPGCPLFKLRGTCSPLASGQNEAPSWSVHTLVRPCVSMWVCVCACPYVWLAGEYCNVC